MRRPIAVKAGLACTIPSAFAPSALYYWIPFQQQGLSAAEVVADKILSDAGGAGIKIGDCATQTPAYGRWQFGGSAGWVLCRSVEGDATLEWSIEGPTPVLAIAVRRDDDSQALYDWWRDSGRSVLPS